MAQSFEEYQKGLSWMEHAGLKGYTKAQLDAWDMRGYERYLEQQKKIDAYNAAHAGTPGTGLTAGPPTPGNLGAGSANPAGVPGGFTGQPGEVDVSGIRHGDQGPAYKGPDNGSDAATQAAIGGNWPTYDRLTGNTGGGGGSTPASYGGGGGGGGGSSGAGSGTISGISGGGGGGGSYGGGGSSSGSSQGSSMSNASSGGGDWYQQFIDSMNRDAARQNQANAQAAQQKNSSEAVTKLIAELTKQTNTANAANKANLVGLNQSITGTQGMLGGAYDTALGNLQGQENLALTKQARQTQNQQGDLMQNMVSRGLGGTTVLPSLQAQVNQYGQENQQGIQNQADLQRAQMGLQKANALAGVQSEGRGINERVTNQSPDLSRYLQLVMQASGLGR